MRAKQTTLYIENDCSKCRPLKLLGVIIDENLSWDETRRYSLCQHHSPNYTSEGFVKIHLISQTSNMKLYYNSYILLRSMDYGCWIWGRCFKQNTLKILKLQKRDARIILSAAKTTLSRTMFSELNWLTFPKRRCKIIPVQWPIRHSTDWLQSISSWSTIICFEFLAQELATMKINLQYHQLWSELPLDIRNITVKNTLKIPSQKLKIDNVLIQFVFLKPIQ